MVSECCWCCPVIHSQHIWRHLGGLLTSVMVCWKVKVCSVAFYLLSIPGKVDNCFHISVPQVANGFKPPSPLLFAPFWINQTKNWRKQVHPLLLNYECWGEWERLNPLKKVLPCVLVPQLITTGSSSHCSVMRPTIRDGKITWWVSWVLLTAGAEWDVSMSPVVPEGRCLQVPAQLSIFSLVLQLYSFNSFQHPFLKFSS